MPTAGRDRRREQRIENAQRWGEWLTTAMAQAHAEPKDILNRAEGAIDKGSLSHWMNGDNTASPEAALTVARILDRDPAEAMRAAGHDVLAEAIAEAVEREYRARLAEMDKEIEARLARRPGTEETSTNGAARDPGSTG
jgi:hypothetical protein